MYVSHKKLSVIRQLLRKKEKKREKIVLLSKTKLNTKEVLISRASIDSYFSQDEFILIKNVLKDYQKKMIKKEKKEKILIINEYVSCY